MEVVRFGICRASPMMLPATQGSVMADGADVADGMGSNLGPSGAGLDTSIAMAHLPGGGRRHSSGGHPLSIQSELHDDCCVRGNYADRTALITTRSRKAGTAQLLLRRARRTRCLAGSFEVAR